MSEETDKSNKRRRYDPLFYKVFCGKGIDIGAGNDALSKKDFPGIESCEGFDKDQGDANKILDFRQANSYDFVYSSHCLEHMHDPLEALKGWYELLKSKGYLIVVAPEEDLYEQGVWPSQYNPDHKRTFTLWKPQSWSQVSVNFILLPIFLLPAPKIIRISLEDTNYDYTLKNVDQTRLGAEANLEMILQKP